MGVTRHYQGCSRRVTGCNNLVTLKSPLRKGGFKGVEKVQQLLRIHKGKYDQIKDYPTGYAGCQEADRGVWLASFLGPGS
jgi:hypothetical protein